MAPHIALLDEIRGLAESAATSGLVLDVNELAGRLRDRHPESGMPMNEVCRAIERAAIEAHAALLAGNGGGAGHVWTDLDHGI